MRKLNFYILFLLSVHILSAQPVEIEKMVQVEDLICFPVLGDSTSYKYLPSTGRFSI